MKKFLLSFFLFISTIAFSLTGQVVKVADGDTITIFDGKEKVKIRFYGIDAPESKQEYGKKSTDDLKKLLDNQEVFIDVKDKDRYGRIVGVVYLNGQDVNLYQVQQGNAWY